MRQFSLVAVLKKQSAEENNLGPEVAIAHGSAFILQAYASHLGHD
jgi:hypothetical protein